MPAAEFLPLVFAALMGLSILVYVALDGYDLGVGVLLPLADDQDKDRMIASIGPFWDANETWLVMAVGLLLVAFPTAHGVILTALYLPVAVMLLGLILRGVAFEFRMKVGPANKRAWNTAFFIGSLMTSLSQGYMLGVYVLGLEESWRASLFGLATALSGAATPTSDEQPDELACCYQAQQEHDSDCHGQGGAEGDAEDRGEEEARQGS